MKRTVAVLMTAALFTIPALQSVVRADEGKTEKDEYAESPQKQKAEEQEAYERYQKAVKKFGENSKQALKAKKRWQHELKEHGHSAPEVTPTK